MSEMPPTAAAKTPSRWEDFIDVFFSPAELFRRRIDGRFGLAFLLFFALSAGLFFATRSAMTPVFDAEWHRALPAMTRAYPNLTPEQLAGAQKTAAKFSTVFFVVGVPLGVFVLGAVVWLVGRILGGALRYAQSVTIAAFAMFPRLIEALVNALQAGFLDERSITSRYSVSLGVARFLDPAPLNPVVLALIGRVDLFTLWVTALIGVGLKAMTRLSTVQAALAAALAWLIGAVPALYQAYRSM